MSKKLVVMGLTFLVMLVLKVSCSASYELLQTTDFKSGVILPWHIALSEENKCIARGFIKDGNYTVHIDYSGLNMFDVQLRHRAISIQKNHTYIVSFSLTSTKDCKVYVRIGDMRAPYWEVWNNNYTPFKIKANEILTVSQEFTADRDSDYAEISFWMGGDLAGELPNEINFISMSLKDKAVPQITPTPLVRDIRVNQLGYLPNAAKKAVLKVDPLITEPQKWDLIDKDGKVVASGNTTV